MSQFSIFFVPLKGDERSEEAMNLCLRTRRVLQVERHVFPEGWTFCVEWLEGEDGGKPQFVRNPQRVDYRDVLPEPVFLRFVKLRTFRKELAQKHGVPPYMVMTDAQLAEVAKMEPPTKEAIAKIDKFGEERMKKYGDAILEAAMKIVAEEGEAARAPLPRGVEPLALQVDDGAEIDLRAFTGGQAIDALTIDLAAGGGTIYGGTAAENGTLALTNVAASGFNLSDALPLTTDGFGETANLKTWAVVVDGAPSKYKVMCSNGQLVLVPPGVCIIFR